MYVIVYRNAVGAVAVTGPFSAKEIAEEFCSDNLAKLGEVHPQESFTVIPLFLPVEDGHLREDLRLELVETLYHWEL